MKVFLIIFALAGTVALQALAGNGGVHGGDLCELEYRGTIPAAADWLKRNGGQSADTVKKFLNKLVSTPVKCVNYDLIIDGVVKSAKTNTSLPLTEVNFKRWSSSDTLAKKALVVHEGLVLIGLEKNGDYHISEKIWKPSISNFKKYKCVTNSTITAGTYQSLLEVTPSSDQGHKSSPDTRYRAQMTLTSKSPSGDTKDKTVRISESLRCSLSEIDNRIVICSDFEFSGVMWPSHYGPVIDTSLVAGGKTMQREKTNSSIKLEIYSPELVAELKANGYGFPFGVHHRYENSQLSVTTGYDVRPVEDQETGDQSYCAVEN